jgi:hypothetical protein
MSKKQMTFEIATEKDLKSLLPGNLILVNLEDDYRDIAIFLEYTKDKKVVCYDCGLQEGGFNTSEYNECIILPDKKTIIKEFEMENLERI